METPFQHPALATGWRQRFESERYLAPLLIGPAVAFMALLVGGPVLLALYLSFTDATAGALQGDFVGFSNYIGAIQSPLFQHAAYNTFLFTVLSQLAVLVIATLLAHGLMRKFPGKWILRFLILLPWAAPISLGTIGWKWIFDSLYSVLNWILRAVHIIGPQDFPQWLGEPKLSSAAIITVDAWRIIPFAVVIIMAGLSSIPPDLEDAARVDGAVGLRKLLYVTAPLTLPITTVALLFGIVFTATDMTVVYILTGGGPFNSTQVVPSWAFQIGIVSGSLGSGAAVALFQFPVLVVVTVVMLSFARRVDVGT